MKMKATRREREVETIGQAISALQWEYCRGGHHDPRRIVQDLFKQCSSRDEYLRFIIALEGAASVLSEVASKLREEYV